MDASVISIEELAKKFRQSLFQRGFSRASLSVLRPCQNSGLLTSDLAVLCLILACHTALDEIGRLASSAPALLLPILFFIKQIMFSAFESSPADWQTEFPWCV